MTGPQEAATGIEDEPKTSPYDKRELGGFTIFEATPEQIRKLDSTALVKLMKRLMLAECRLADIPLRATAVPLQISVADGGEDGRIEWSGGVDETDYFPTRFCAFQSKAQNLTESMVKAEILKKQESGPPKLNEAVLEVLSRRGAYIVFCSHAFGGQKIKKLRKAIMDAIREGGNPDEAEAIEVYDANRIADWVNTHTAVALWLTAQTRGRALAGFLSHESWGRSPDNTAVPWIDDDVARFVPVSLVIPDAERREQSRNAWTFGQAATSALKYLAEDKVALRVAGPSGFGKSRFVYELFNRHKTTAEETENAAVIYADLSIAGDTVLQLALELSDCTTPAILVVDECPDEIHTKLVGLAKRAGSRLCLVTIDVETKRLGTRKTGVPKTELRQSRDTPPPARCRGNRRSHLQ